MGRRYAPANRLTPRQVEIIGLLAEGLVTAQIAERLHVTPSTVSSHVRKAGLRVGVRGAAAPLVAWAYQHGQLGDRRAILAELARVRNERDQLRAILQRTMRGQSQPGGDSQWNSRVA